MSVEDSSQLPSSIKMTMVEAPAGAPSGGPDTVRNVLRSKSSAELIDIARRPDVPDDGFEAVVDVIRDRWADVVASGSVDSNLLRQEVGHTVATSASVGEASKGLRVQARDAEEEARQSGRYATPNHGMVAGAITAVRENISASQTVAGGRIDNDSVRRMDRAARVAAAFGMSDIDFSLVGAAQVAQAQGVAGALGGGDLTQRLIEVTARLADVTERMTDPIKQLQHSILPDRADAQGQFDVVRPLLFAIDTAVTEDQQTMTYINTLQRELVNMAPEVAREVTARLSLSTCASLMRLAGGYMVRPERGQSIIMTIPEAAGRALAQKSDISRDVVKTIFIDIKGANVGAAWDYLEYANLGKDAPRGRLLRRSQGKAGYEQLVQEVNERGRRAQGTSWVNFETDGTTLYDDDPTLGTARVNFYTDKDDLRREAVRGLLMDKLVEDGSVKDIDEARLSLRMAEKFAEATLRTSVWNMVAQSGNDEPAECYDFGVWRTKRGLQPKTSGPENTIGKLGHLGCDWVSLIANDGILSSEPIGAERIAGSIKEISAGSWNGHMTSTMSKVMALREELLNTRPRPDDETDRNMLKTRFDQTKAAAGGDEAYAAQIRQVHVSGVIYQALTFPSIGWTDDQVDNWLGQILVTPLSTDMQKPYLTPQQVDQIKRDIEWIDPRKGKRFGYTDLLNSMDARAKAYARQHGGGGGGGRR